MSLVSVIIPNFNHSKHLEQRIESVLNQTYQDFEVILLDDKSPDNSVEILEKYKSHPRVSHLVINTENSGSTFKQWKKGLELTKGQYVWIAESDDYCESNFLESLVPLLANNSNVNFAYSQSWKVNELNEVIGDWADWTRVLHPTRWDTSFINNGQNEIINYFSTGKNTIPNASAVLFRKMSLDINDEIVKYRLCGDKMIWTSLMLKGDVAFCSKHLNYFREHSNNVRSGTGLYVSFKEELSWCFLILNSFVSDITVRKNIYKFISFKYFLLWLNFKSYDLKELFNVISMDKFRPLLKVLLLSRIPIALFKTLMAKVK